MKYVNISHQSYILQILLDGLTSTSLVGIAGICGSWSMSEMVADDLLSDVFQKRSSATLLMWQSLSTGNLKIFFY